MLLSPLSCRFDSTPLICFPMIRYVVRERVVRIRRAQQRLDAQQYRPDLQGWAPLVLQDIQTDAAEPVNVRMVNFSQEPNLRRRHGILLGQEELQLKDAVLIRCRTDSWRRLTQKALGFLHDAPGEQTGVGH